MIKYLNHLKNLKFKYIETIRDKENVVQFTEISLYTYIIVKNCHDMFDLKYLNYFKYTIGN